MTAGLAFLNGNVISDDELSVSVLDSGFVMGITVSEQLRTFNGQLFKLNEHLHRLKDSLSIVGIEGVNLETLATKAETIASHNHSLMQHGDDLGLTIFVTPGLPGSCGAGESRPTIGMYTAPLPFHRWAKKYTAGEQLVVSSVRQVPDTCWPAKLKCRSRMHYFLADREVQSQSPDARALLLDQDDFVAEASTASVLIYLTGEGLIAPKPEKVLPSMSARVVKSLCEHSSISVVHRDIAVDDILSAAEVFLTSTSPCILPVVRVNETRINNGEPGPVFQSLLKSWNELVGLDIAQQAAKIDCR